MSRISGTGDKMPDGFRAPWQTRIAVWRLMADGHSDFGISKMNLQIPHFPADASTVAKIRRAFFALERGDLVRAINDEPELKKLLKDEQILLLMVRAFSRPAFETRIIQEHSVLDFRDAITDTIDVLNTGYVKTRDGRMLERIPDLYYLKDESKQAVVLGIVRKLNRLRTMCDDARRDGTIVQSDTVLEIAPEVADSLDTARIEILADFRSIYPRFNFERKLLLQSDSSRTKNLDTTEDSAP